MKIKNIAVFASGAGSNAEVLIRHFLNHPKAKVRVVVCNNANAGVLRIAENYGVEVLLGSNEWFAERGKDLVKELQSREIDLIVLAGFLRKIPLSLIQAFPQRIINIHPALLPKFGGKGMFGSHVHKAVLEAGEKETGISVHYVTEHYDEGGIVFQTSFPIESGFVLSDIEKRIHQLEHKHYPLVVEQILEQC
jgi:phosphoribosylglycinamide formyltransferase-1